MLREIFSGIAQRIRLENSLQLQKAKLIRPKVIRLEIAQTFHHIETQLADKDLRKLYDSITLEVEA